MRCGSLKRESSSKEPLSDTNGHMFVDVIRGNLRKEWYRSYSESIEGVKARYLMRICLFLCLSRDAPAVKKILKKTL